MVRLRLNVSREGILPSTISIPHGTIKTKAIIKAVMLYLISIPHGTIKTGTPLSRNLIDLISIPHGTIKTSETSCCVLSNACISIPHGTIKTSFVDGL